MVKKVILGANYSIVEPLGLLHLSSVARQEGFDPKIVLIRGGDFQELDDLRRKLDPAFIGFQSFTGNHLDSFRYLETLEGVQTILGGPHATYFPKESSKHVDYAVLSEGFDSFRRILRDSVPKGIVALERQEQFPEADRESFYKDYPEHRDNQIKSIITKTGCPYACTYCYNSSGLKRLEGELTEDQYNKMKVVLGRRQRLFPSSKRSVEDILSEIKSIKEFSTGTKMIYFQDDVFGADIKWLREFAQSYDKEFPYHAQLRFEYANPDKKSGRERLNLLKESGCTGLTFAIEAANMHVRKEVLNRHMEEELMFKTLAMAKELGFKVRTEQMLGLPLGATSERTAINLDADLETLELNVRLREKTGLPDLAWTSIFAPYEGTEIAKYCAKHGFSDADIDSIPQSFFEKSILKFPLQWEGEGLSPLRERQWMSEKGQQQYRQDMLDLKERFSMFAQIPRGHELAREFLSQSDRSAKKLDDMLKKHLFDKVIYGIE